MDRQKTARGLVLPINCTANIYLRNELARRGVSVSTIPPKCIAELTSTIVLTSKMVAEVQGIGWRQGITDSLEWGAFTIAVLLGVCEPPEFYPDMAGEAPAEDYAEILARHGVRTRQST